MAATFKLEISTPLREFLNEEVEMIIVRTPLGEMGVLPDHEQMTVVVEIGPIKIKRNDEWAEAVLTSGFMEITDKHCVILCDTAEWPHEIDEGRAFSAKQRAEERLQQSITKLEYMRSKAALARALSRLRVKNFNS